MSDRALDIGTEGPVLLRRTRRRHDAEQLALVLAAAGIACGLAADSAGIALYVDAADAPRAFDELDAFERERAVPPAEPAMVGDRGGVGAALVFARSCCSSSACSSATGGPTGRRWARRRRA